MWDPALSKPWPAVRDQVGQGRPGQVQGAGGEGGQTMVRILPGLSQTCLQRRQAPCGVAF